MRQPVTGAAQLVAGCWVSARIGADIESVPPPQFHEQDARLRGEIGSQPVVGFGYLGSICNRAGVGGHGSTLTARR